MATAIRNNTLDPVPLPAAYGSFLLRGGAACVVADTPANVAAALGSTMPIFSLVEVPDGQLGAIVPSGVSRVMSLGVPAAKSATNVHTAFAGNAAGSDFGATHLAGGADAITAVTASLDLGALGDTTLNTVVQAKSTGTGGNAVTVALDNSGAPASGVVLSEVGSAVTITYEDGVSTVGDVETAIATSTKIAVKTPGTAATVLSGNTFAATHLAGGVNAAAAVKAEKSLGTLADGKLDTVVRAKVAGVAGNNITVASVGDQSSGTITTETGTAVTIHYTSQSSTTADVEAAIAADSALIEVKTTGTGANVLGEVKGLNFPGPFTNPDVPRNLRVTMATGWDGGDVTVPFLDQFDQPTSETFAAGSNVVRVGSKICKRVLGATHSLAGSASATASIGTGDKLGTPTKLRDANVLMFVDTAMEVPTVDLATSAITPSTVPNAAHAYTLIGNV